MVEAIKKYLLQNWSKFSILGDPVQDLSYIQISTSRGKKFSQGRIVYLFFRPEEDTPCLVAKMYRDESNVENLRNEHNNHMVVHKGCDEITSRPIVLDKINGKFVIIESVALGIAMKVQLHNFVFSNDFRKDQIAQNAEADFEHVATLISKINQLRRDADTQYMREELHEIREEFQTNFNTKKEIQNHIGDSIEQFIDSSIGNSYRRIVHFDLIPRNIYIEKQQRTVIDWEFSKESTLLFMEPVRFVFYYWKEVYQLGLIQNDISEHRSFQETVLNENHWLGDLVLQLLEKTLQFDGPQLKKIVPGIFLFFSMFESNLQYSVAHYFAETTKSYHEGWVNFFLQCNDHDKLMNYIFEKENETLRTENETRIKYVEEIHNSITWRIGSSLHKLRKKLMKFTK